MNLPHFFLGRPARDRPGEMAAGWEVFSLQYEKARRIAVIRTSQMVYANKRPNKHGAAGEGEEDNEDDGRTAFAVLADDGMAIWLSG